MAETAQALITQAVADVTAVQASNDAAIDVTAEQSADVTDVTGVAHLVNQARTIGGEDDEGLPTVVFPAMEERSRFAVHDDWFRVGGEARRWRPGVYWHGIQQVKGVGEVPVDTWICSPLHVEAITSDAQDNNFGRLLRFRNSVGRWRTWAMPMELLRGSGEELRGELLAMGLEIDPKGRTFLGQYLQSKPPKKRVRCALQVGWCEDVFVLPDTVIGPAADTVIFQSGERFHDEHGCLGSLADWRAQIAARAVGNPLLMVALSAAFAGPLLAKCNAESGGIHFVGDSSTGKTTCLEAACSVWGGPNYRRSWRATANGMEGAAALFNDSLLALDEISECDPREVGTIVYSLGNGRGKQRAQRTGSARNVVRWRCMVVSSGERTIATHMQDAGHRVKAGQSVRLLDLPATRRFGAWDDLHDLPSGTAFSDAIKHAATTQYGHVGRAFLEQLTRDRRDFSEALERIRALPEFTPANADGQEKRSAGRFALIALAGELATDYGLTGWPEGEAVMAAADAFRAWRTNRGQGNDEARQIVDQLGRFIERHGDSRFSAAIDDRAVVRDRAGWWRDDGERGRLYLFNSDGMREALKGFDFKRALAVIEQHGVIPKAGANGERAKVQRIGGRAVKVYEVRADVLGKGYGN